MKRKIFKAMGIAVLAVCFLSSNLIGVGIQPAQALIGEIIDIIGFIFDAKDAISSLSCGPADLRVSASVPIMINHVGDFGEYYVQVDATVPSDNSRYYLVVNVYRDDGQNITQQTEDLFGPRRYEFKFTIEGHKVGVDHIYSEVKLYEYVTTRVGHDKATADVQKPELKKTVTTVKQPFDIKVPYRLERVDIEPDKRVRHRENFTVTLYATVLTQATGNVTGQVMGTSFNKTLSGVSSSSESKEEELGSYTSCHAEEESPKGQTVSKVTGKAVSTTGKLSDEYEGTPPHLEEVTFDVLPLNAHFVIPKGYFKVPPDKDYVLDLNAGNCGIPSGDLKITCVGAHVMGEFGDSIGGRDRDVKVVPSGAVPDVAVQPPDVEPPEVEPPDVEPQPPTVTKPDVEVNPPQVSVTPPSSSVEGTVVGSGQVTKEPVSIAPVELERQNKDIQMKKMERR